MCQYDCSFSPCLHVVFCGQICSGSGFFVSFQAIIIWSNPLDCYHLIVHFCSNYHFRVHFHSRYHFRVDLCSIYHFVALSFWSYHFMIHFCSNYHFLFQFYCFKIYSHASYHFRVQAFILWPTSLKAIILGFTFVQAIILWPTSFEDIIIWFTSAGFYFRIHFCSSYYFMACSFWSYHFMVCLCSEYHFRVNFLLNSLLLKQVWNILVLFLLLNILLIILS